MIKKIRKRNIFAMALAALVAAAGLQALPASNAEAAPPTGCITERPRPTGDGNKVKGTAKMVCPAGFGLQAALVGVHIQEQVGPLWVDRGSGKTNGSSGITNTVTQTFTCNGHGTDNWRTRTWATDNFNRTTYGQSSLQSITC